MMSLDSFAEPIDALVVGANGGLGGGFVDALCQSGNVRSIHAWSRKPVSAKHAIMITRTIDAGDEVALRKATAEIDRLSLVIVATGALHNADGLFPEKTWKELDPEQMAESFRVNTILPTLIAKHTLSLLPRKTKAVFCVLSARVGSISDNRLGGWYSYRASKAALNQIIRSLSIEVRRTRPEAICLGVHPGTVDTSLSEPFQKSLAKGHTLFSPAVSAAHLLHVINQAKPEQTGSLIAWDGTLIDP